MDLFHARLQTLRVALDPRVTERQRRPLKFLLQSGEKGNEKKKRRSFLLLLDLLLVAFPLEPLQRLSAVALLGLALFLKDLNGLVEGLDGCALHLQLLRKATTDAQFDV